MNALLEVVSYALAAVSGICLVGGIAVLSGGRN